MIDFYTWGTPNGRKVSIALEEMELSYKTIAINIMKDEQFSDDFLRISPNNKIPALVDHETNVSLMESGAILVYLAEKTGKFYPEDNRWPIMQWLMWQMGGLGPMAGQTHHFLKFNPGVAPYAEERFSKETNRLYGVLDKQLGLTRYVAGDYSIADMAIWPWISRFEWQQIDLASFKNVARWYRAIADRPAVQRGYKVPVDAGDIPLP